MARRNRYSAVGSDPVAPRLAALALLSVGRAQQHQPTPRPTYKPRDSSWDYDDDGGPTTGDYVVTVASQNSLL